MRFCLIIMFLCFQTTLFGQKNVTFIIESVPGNTPPEDTIFISGTFNKWATNETKYMLKPRADGKLAVSVPADSNFHYKFVRGNWMKVETNSRNQYIPNRFYHAANNADVIISIDNWQDLGGEKKKINFILFILIAATFNGFALIFMTLRIKTPRNPFFKYFLLFNILPIIILFGGIVLNQTNIIWQARISIVGNSLFFVWGPSLYFFVKSMFKQEIKDKIYTNFIPFALFLFFIFLRIVNIGYIKFLTTEIKTYLTVGNLLVLIFGLIFNVIYHYKSLKYIILSTNLTFGQSRFFGLFIYISSLMILLGILLNTILLIRGIQWGVLQNFEFIFIIISIMILFEFFYILKYPEILTENLDLSSSENKIIELFQNENHSKERKETNLQISLEVSNEILLALTKFMEEEKIFTNPDLNITMLSDLIETKPHILSRILNTHFNKNFRDYINEYRVKEFIKISTLSKYKNYSLVALGYEVGFNSKSTFNLVFKKITGRSPREFIKQTNVIDDSNML